MMRTGTAREGQLQKELCNMATEIDRLKDVVGALQTEKDARIKGLEHLQNELRKHIAAAAQWEERFDRLLRIASPEGVTVVKCE